MADSTNEPVPVEPILVPPAEEAAAPILEAEPEIGSHPQLPPEPKQDEQPSELMPEGLPDGVPVLQSESVPQLPTEALQVSQDQEPLVKMDVVPPELLPETPADSAPVLQSEQEAQELSDDARAEEAPQIALPSGEAVLTEEVPQDPQPAEPLLEEGEPLPEQQGEASGDQTPVQSAMPTLEAPASVPVYNPQQTPPPISPPKITSYTAVHTTTGIMRYTPGIMSALAGKYSNSSQLVEQLVLNCAGCISLSDICVLDMSNRKIMNLDPAVFSRMPDLEELDLSFNKIKGFDTQVGLRKLRYLNMKKNCLKSVLTLEQFPNMEELNIEDNILTKLALIVDLTDCPTTLTFHRSSELNSDQLLSIPVSDDEEGDLDPHLNPACQFLGEILNSGQAALVSSDHGLSRSVCVVLAYLMVFYKWSLKEAHKHLSACKSNIRPHRAFVHQLSKWQKTVFGETLTDISDPNF